MAETRLQRLERLDEAVCEFHLCGGFVLRVLPKPGWAKKYASVATRYGSLDRRFRASGSAGWLEVPDGIAHFLEHQLFAQEYGDAFDKFSELGASANAFTTFTSTTYLFSATENFPACFELLLDFVQSPHFTDEGTRKERGIIQQEIRMYQDNPHWRLGQNLREALYVAHPVRIDIAGTVESVEAITTDLLRVCYDIFYHPANMVASVVGDVDPEAVAELAEASLARRGYRPRPPVERDLPREPAHVNRPQVRERMPVSRPMLVIGFKDVETPASGQELVRRELATEVALDCLLGISSDLYNELYEGGLLDGSFETSFYGEREFGLSTLGGDTDRPDELYRRILAGIERLRRDGVAPDELERSRRRLYGDLAGQFDSPEALSHWLNAAYFHGLDLADYLAAVQALQVEDVNERLKAHFVPERHAVSVIEPL